MTIEIVRQPDSVRPFRLWDAKAKKALRWRCYSDKRRAHIGALIEARWSMIGTVVEVFDIRNGKLLGQYVRRLDTVTFTDTNGAPK
jgi:hypothetical protein